MKVEKLKNILNNLPKDQDIRIVTGEHWLPEQLVNTELDNNLLFLEFDNAPDEGEQGLEARGFVEHEVELLRQRLDEIVKQSDDSSQLLDALTGFFLVGHEASSAEFIELLEQMESSDETLIQSA
ncbi:hypothetical protein [Vibrio sp. 10N]|uniref:hypothetical protein n=1 Tax=Vibrio sp. 10N TaxID=3058938 RepID=UPI002812FA7F|nr:hypothetical protein VB10N_15740 [Vibrio sp. 10N]